MVPLLEVSGIHVVPLLEVSGMWFLFWRLGSCGWVASTDTCVGRLPFSMVDVAQLN